LPLRRFTIDVGRWPAIAGKATTTLMRFARRRWDVSRSAVALLAWAAPRNQAVATGFYFSPTLCRVRDIPDFWRCAAAWDARPPFRVPRVHPASPARFHSTQSDAGADLKSRLAAQKGRRKSGAFPEVLSPSVRWPCRAVRCCRHPDDPASAFRIDLRTSPRAGPTREPIRRPCGFSLPSHEGDLLSDRNLAGEGWLRRVMHRRNISSACDVPLPASNAFTAWPGCFMPKLLKRPTFRSVDRLSAVAGIHCHA